MPEETVPQDNFDRRLAHLQSNSLAAGLSSPTLTMHRSNFTFYISLMLTGFFGGNGGKGLTTVAGEASLRRWLGSGCPLPFTGD
jgi:hypothetical protein